MNLVIFGCAINHKKCNFYHITSGLGKKIKLNSRLLECQFHEIEVNANTVGNEPASYCVIKLTAIGSGYLYDQTEKYNEGVLTYTVSTP